MEIGVFDEVGELVRAMAPAELGPVAFRAHRYGVKVWLDASTPPREHYEAQVVGAAADPAATVLAVEVGFHAEHADPSRNEAVLARLVAGERSWRRALGPTAEAGPFLGRDGWVRVSETWPDPDLAEPDAAFALASRLVDYLAALEPVRGRTVNRAGR